MCQLTSTLYAATQSCSYTQSVRTPQQNCEQSHGYYDAAAQSASRTRVTAATYHAASATSAAPGDVPRAGTR